MGVNEGHPDKLADQVSDAVLDACLKVDPYSKVACESCCKDNMVMVFGEITTKAPLDYDKIVRETCQGIGYDVFEEDLASVKSKGLSCHTADVKVAQQAEPGHCGWRARREGRDGRRRWRPGHHVRLRLG